MCGGLEWMSGFSVLFADFCGRRLPLPSPLLRSGLFCRPARGAARLLAAWLWPVAACGWLPRDAERKEKLAGKREGTGRRETAWAPHVQRSANKNKLCKTRQDGDSSGARNQDPIINGFYFIARFLIRRTKHETGKCFSCWVITSST